MKQFWSVLRRFVAPYKGCVAGSVVMNVLSAVFNIFSFAMIIPIMKMIFQIDKAVYSYMPFTSGGQFQFKVFKEALINNMYYYVQTVIDTRGASFALFAIGAVLGLMTALKTACYFGSTAVMVPMRTGIVRDIRTKLYDKLLSLPLGFFSDERKGDIIARMSGDVAEVENSITSVLDMLIKNPILIIFYFTTLLLVSWKLTLFTITVVPLIAWGMSALGKRLKADSLDAQNRLSDTMTTLDETLGGLRIVKAFLAEKKMSGRFRSTADEYRKACNRVSVRQASAHPVSEFLGTLMIMLVLWYGGTLILNENSSIDAPPFIFHMGILYSVPLPPKDFARATYMIPRGLASVERIDKILMAENNIREKADAVALDSFKDSIVFKDVCFTYENGAREVLTGINLEVPKGKTIAIVGQSGSGKSTLVDLVPRYRDVSGGCILIDGHDVRDVKIATLRALIGNVNQEAILFNDTIFNNIAFGVENATLDQVIAAAKIANAHDFIMEKEEGYFTTIGDRGSKLSGGQRQRISIARAILKNPDILILDEATSALDTESERLVQEALDRLTSSRTTIAIAHRLSTIKNADLICVMQDGRIVERGRHDELIALGGYYKKLNDMQAL
ncbi:MAG: ABC transporter ATP-binding protein/permease [Bacteroidales bacterium]|nr:ABC transporter ATP-binding protein/permease [Bacteroidales bacterium]